MPNPSTILFAGGGTGGHIFPGIAIAECLNERPCRPRCHFLVSNRPLDQQILDQSGFPYTRLPFRGLPSRRWDAPGLVGFARAGLSGLVRVRSVIKRIDPIAVVAMGGFVSAPVIWAARRAGITVGLINLDAPPGRANRVMARSAQKIFSVCPGLVGEQRIGLPIRRSALGPADRRLARRRLSLDPQRRVLLVTGGSQGARTMNQMMVHLIRFERVRSALESWQVLHLVGRDGVEPLQHAYAQARIDAVVIPFCQQMGLAWVAASLAISRAGAGSVAEAQANGTPTVFLPYPFHRDQHQKHNAQTVVRFGGAEVYEDRIDPVANAAQLAGPVAALACDRVRRVRMSKAMRDHRPADGAAAVAQWLVGFLEPRR